MNSEIPQVSVIVPVYNVEKYLSQCIESVLTQTFRDFELILVNDGSRDRSGEICERYAQKDLRIRVYHQDNQGVSVARNLGIDQARSEWLCIIDSDDYIGKDYLHAFMNEGCLSEDCLNLQGWHSVNEEGISVSSVKYSELLINGHSFAYAIPEYQLFSNSAPWAKLFNRNVIKRYNLRYPLNLPVREDAIFSYNYRMHIKSIQLLSASEYYYRLPGKRITLSHSNHKPGVFLSVREVLPPLIKNVFQTFDLKGSNYEKQVVSYFKNQTGMSLLKSTYAYRIKREERLRILHILFDDKDYFNDPAFHIKPLLKLFKTISQLMSPAILDALCYIPFHFYYKYIRGIK